jgi:phage terminase Nu1 subunit (DNA packaging protein)
MARARSIHDAPARGWLTRRQLAPRLGVHPESIVRWEREGMPCKRPGRHGRPSWFSEREVRAWLAAREAAVQTAGPVDLMRERARREKAQAVLAEQLFQARARALLPADEVEKKWTQEIAGAKAILLASYTQGADKVFHAATTDGLRGVERELQAIVFAALRELAGPNGGGPGRRADRRDVQGVGKCAVPARNRTKPERAPLARVNGNGREPGQ